MMLPSEYADRREASQEAIDLSNSFMVYSSMIFWNEFQ